MIWVYFFFKIILSGAIIGVGAGLVRNVHSQAGLMLAGAGGVELLTLCCFRGIGIIGSGNRLYTFLEAGVGIISTLLFFGLIIAALMMLAKELVRRKEAAGTAAPKIF